MYCKNCGSQIPDSAKFCIECGERIEIGSSSIKNDYLPANQEQVHQNEFVNNAVSEKKKKSKWWIWVLVVFFIVVFIVVIGNVFSKNSANASVAYPTPVIPTPSFQTLPTSSVSESETSYSTPYHQWNKPLPDGLSAKINISPDDDTILFVHYKNNTGEDIALATYYSIGEKDGSPLMDGMSSFGFFADGTEKIELIEAWDEIGYCMLDYEIGKVYKKIDEANKSLTYDFVENKDGSVSVTFYTSIDFVDVDGFIFYLDEKDNVIGYERFGIGFPKEYPMTCDFEAPEFEYARYLLSYEAYT